MGTTLGPSTTPAARNGPAPARAPSIPNGTYGITPAPSRAFKGAKYFGEDTPRMQATVTYRPPTAISTPLRTHASSAAPHPWVSWLVPTMGHLIFVACILVVLSAGPKFISADGDAARHLTVGQHMLSRGAILTEDIFSFTRGGDHFVPYEWLAEVASALSYRAGGLAGVVLLHASAIGLACALLYGQLRRQGHALLLALPVSLLAAAASAVHWLARPHVFTFLGAVVFIRVLDDWYAGRSTRHALWALPATMLLWVNAHGGFLIGLILIAAFVGADLLRAVVGADDPAEAARRRLRDSAAPLAATVAATLLNPAGPALYGHVTGYFGKKLLVDLTVEYRSPDFHSPDSTFFVALLLLLVVSLAWSRRRPALHEGLLCAAFTYFALHSARNIPLFALVVAPTLAAQLAALPRPELGGRFDALARRVASWTATRNRAYSRIESRSRGSAIPALALAALVGAALWQSAAGDAPLGVRFDGSRLPVAAVDYLQRSHVTGNGFNELRWGGYLLHELWPEQRVFIDGQTDFYGEPLTRTYIALRAAQPGWEATLDRYEVQWVILDRSAPLVRELRRDPAWGVLYEDSLAAVLAR